MLWGEGAKGEAKVMRRGEKTSDGVAEAGGGEGRAVEVCAGAWMTKA